MTANDETSNDKVAASSLSRSEMGKATHNNSPGEMFTDTSGEEGDWSPFFDYLQTPQGHEIASRVLGVVEDVKKSTLDKNSEHSRMTLVVQGLIIGVIIGAGTWLASIDKLTSTISALLGTIVGYIAGRKSAL